jgi:NAD-dependent deacetylase
MPYHMDLIDLKLTDCDLFVAVGTSGVVYPAAGFVRQAGIQGATTLEINKEISEVSNHFQLHRQGPATREVTALVRELLAG